jgi:hypothetical protein
MRHAWTLLLERAECDTEAQPAGIGRKTSNTTRASPDRQWRQIADRELVHSHDRNVIQDLLDHPGRPVERNLGRLGGSGPDFAFIAV